MATEPDATVRDVTTHESPASNAGCLNAALAGAYGPAGPAATRPGNVAPGLERLVFFSDAVFAIAITLLVLELRLPDRPGGYTDATLLDALAGLMPSVFAFGLSFVIIATFWLGHFRTFGVVVRSDSWLVAIDLVFLFFVALLPFPTSIIAREGNLPAAAILYAAFGTVASLVSAMLWIYPSRMAGLISPAVPARVVRHVTYRTLVAPAIFVLSIPVALVSPVAAEACWFLTFPLQALVSRRFGLGPTIGAVVHTPER
jgi:uncharacterized membrane protein